MDKFEKISLTIILVVIAVLFFISGQKDRNYYNHEAVTISGDHAFIALNIEGAPEKNAVAILNTLNNFERDYNVRVTHYSISFQPQTEEKNAKVIGIWTTHCPKTKTPA